MADAVNQPSCLLIKLITDVLQGLPSDPSKNGQAPGGKCPIFIWTPTLDKTLFKAFYPSNNDVDLELDNAQEKLSLLQKTRNAHFLTNQIACCVYLLGKEKLNWSG